MSDKFNIFGKSSEKRKTSSSTQLGVKDLIKINDAIENKPLENAISLIEKTDKDIDGVTVIALSNKIINSNRARLEKNFILIALLKCLYFNLGKVLLAHLLI